MQWEKIDLWKCVGKRHRWRLNGTEQWVGEMQWSNTGCCVLNICERIQPEQQNGMTALTCGVEWRSHLWRVVLRWVKWTERNEVKGGCEVRHEQHPPKRNERREWTCRKHMEIKLVLFFDTVTTNGWRGTLEVFGQRSGAKALDICAAIIHNGVIGFFIGFIPSWKLKKPINYMLCIIALSWLFSGASFCFLWVDWNSGFEKTSLWKKGWLQKVWQKKATKRGLCGSHKKDCASHEVRMVRIFCGWGLRSCP